MDIPETKLHKWMRIANENQIELLALACATSVGYLRLLSNVHRENPKVRLALDIVHGANSIRGAYNAKLPVIRIQDLATPTRRTK